MLLFKEGYSVQYASNVVDKIWSTAAKLGYIELFPSSKEVTSQMIICL